MIGIGDKVLVKGLNAYAGSEDNIDKRLSLGVKPGDIAKIKAIKYDNKLKSYVTVMVSGEALGKEVTFSATELHKKSTVKRNKTLEEKHRNKIHITKRKIINAIRMTKDLLKKLEVIKRSVSERIKDEYGNITYK